MIQKNELIENVNNVSEPTTEKLLRANRSGTLMKEDEFWEIIDSTKRNSENDFEEQQRQLSIKLSELSTESLTLFGNRFISLKDNANVWGLWASLYLKHGGYQEENFEEDVFNNFKEWLISQGKDFYYEVLENPESVTEVFM